MKKAFSTVLMLAVTLFFLNLPYFSLEVNATETIGAYKRVYNLDAGYYVITSCLKETARLDMDNGSSEDGTNVHIYNRETSDITLPEVWMLFPSSEKGLYVLINYASQTALDANWGGSAIGWAANYVNNQIFELYQNGDQYIIRSVANGKVLNVKGGKTGNGNDVQMYDYDGTDSCHWNIQSAVIEDESGCFRPGIVNWAKENTGEGLCCQYVSDAVFHGGGVLCWEKSCTNLVADLIKKGYGTLIELSVEPNGTVSTVTNEGNILPADLIFLKSNDSRPYEHVVVVTSVSPEGVVCVCARNNIYRNEIYNGFNENGWKAYVFHFN